MEDNFQMMDDYLKGTLDPKGVRLFNRKLKNEPDFEVQFREMKAIQEAAHASAKLSTMAKLQEIEASIAEKETTKIEFSMKKLVSVAASLILIATVSYFTVFNTPDIATGQEIYNEYYQPYQNIVSGAQRGEAVELGSLKDRAYFAYDARTFSEAASLFAELVETEKTGLNYLYAGISNIESGDLEIAKKDLNTVINNFEDYEVQGQWFLAMTLLKEGTEESKEEAYFSLIDLSLSNSSYTTKAKEALSKLGVDFDSEDDGTVANSQIHPNSEGNSPDGSSFMGLRQVQFGLIDGDDSRRYKFFNDRPIEGLQKGDRVSFIPFTVKKKGRGVSLAYITNVR